MKTIALKNTLRIEKFRDFSEMQDILGFILSTKGKNITLLDMGCGFGHLIKFGDQFGISCVGIDIDKDRLEKGRNRFPEISDKLILKDCGDALLTFGENSFDVITMLGVVEHLPDPEKILIDVEKLLKKKGYLLITTPFGKNDSNAHGISLKTLSEWVKIISAIGFKVKAPYGLVDPSKYSTQRIVRLLTRISVIADYYRTNKGKKYLNTQRKFKSAYLGILAIKQ
jgi:2-polyprenyl-3-methyl-5-hydroxy-6-metoxy-1,4-benzoquinol methylase